jgi:toxin FitB
VADLLVHTDIFIDHLRGARVLKPGRHSLSYSVITRYELFAGCQVDEEKVGLLLSPFRELALTGDIAELAGRVRRTTPIRTPDALIAPTALTHGLTLVTRNRHDFESVPRLRLRETAA